MKNAGKEMENMVLQMESDGCADAPLPERELCKAVLVQALEDIGRSPQMDRDARCYFTAHNPDYIFSFANVCQCLGIDPQAARRAVLARREPLVFERRRVAFASKLGTFEKLALSAG